MVGALEHVTLEPPLCERDRGVWTAALDGVEAPPGVADQHGPIADLHLAQPARGEIGHVDDEALSHAAPLPGSP